MKPSDDFYHFTGNRLRDGASLPAIGEWLQHSGAVEMCASGLHASRTPFDALTYAPGPILHRVRLRGDIVEGHRKCVARERLIIASEDAAGVMRQFACAQALSVAPNWNAPDVLINYLMDMDDGLRVAALATAREAALGAAKRAIWVIAWARAYSHNWIAPWWGARAATWAAANGAGQESAWAAASITTNGIPPEPMAYATGWTKDLKNITNGAARYDAARTRFNQAAMGLFA